jgi:hypothetical protein
MRTHVPSSATKPADTWAPVAAKSMSSVTKTGPSPVRVQATPSGEVRCGTCDTPGKPVNRFANMWNSPSCSNTAPGLMKASSIPVCSRLTTGSSEANENSVAGGAALGATDASDAADEAEGATESAVALEPPQAARVRLAMARMAADRRRGRELRGRIGARTSSMMLRVRNDSYGSVRK